MQKINLEALESKNMTAVSEDTLSEINGGCTFKYMTSACGRHYWNRISSCKDACPVAAVSFVKRVYRPDATKVVVRKDQCAVKGWHVEVGGTDSYAVSNNNPSGTWFRY